MFKVFGGDDKTPAQKALDDIASSADKGDSTTPYKGSGFDPTGLERAAKAVSEAGSMDRGRARRLGHSSAMILGNYG